MRPRRFPSRLPALAGALFVACLLPAGAHATGIPVVDALANANIMGQTTMQLTEFAKEIENQAQQIEQYYTQIQQLTTMIDQGKESLRIAGDPATLLKLIGVKEITGSNGLASVTQLLQSPSVSQIFSSANPAQSLSSSGSQMFSSGQAIGQTMGTTGTSRDLSLYKNIATLEGIFNQLTSTRQQDRTVQQTMTSKISSLTEQLKTAKDNATRDTLMAGIHAAQATMQASTAEVQKQQADYLASERQRRVQEEKQQIAMQEEWDAGVAAARQDHATQAAASIEKQQSTFRQTAQQVQSKSPGTTSNGDELLRIPTN